MEEQKTERGEGTFGEAALRQVLGQFATGVSVVTARDRAGRPRAITVSAFSALSLDPPLVLFCLDRSAFHFDVFANATAFAVNLLEAEQQAMSDRFAREADDEFSDLATGRLATGSPVLPECLAVLDCETDSRHAAGDHLIIIGRVVAIENSGAGDPLIYYRGGYRRLRP